MTSEAAAYSKQISETLAKDNYIVLKGKLKVGKSLEESFQAFAKTFEKLTQQGSAASFLNRKVDTGVFSVSPKGAERSYIWNRDSAVQFENQDLYKNVFLEKLLQFTVASLPNDNKYRTVHVMLSRHDQSVDGLDPHSDGLSEWLVQYNINRSPKGIKGGEIQIVDENGKKLQQHLFDSPLDCYFVKDDALMHAATALEIEEGSVRDTLILRVEKKEPMVWGFDSEKKKETKYPVNMVFL